MPDFKLTKDQTERQVKFMPTILEFAGFVFMISGTIMGPFIEFSDFKNWIELTGNYKRLPVGAKGGVTIIPSLTKLVIGFTCMATFIVVTDFLGFSI